MAVIAPADADILDAWLYSSTHTEAGRHAAVRALFARRPDLARATRDGIPLLACALDLVDTDGDLGARGRQLADILFAAGADPNAIREDNEALLVGYGRFAKLQAIDLLLAHGADPDARDAAAWTPLHSVASLPGHPSTPPEQQARNLAAARRLLDGRADLEARNMGGKTPLAIAAFLGHRTMTELLLAAGADIDSIDDSGYSVLAACMLRVADETPGQPRFAMDEETAATRDVINLLIVRGAKDLTPESFS